MRARAPPRELPPPWRGNDRSAPSVEVGSVIFTTPVTQPLRTRWRFRCDQAVVPGKPGQCQPQDDLRRPLRPALRIAGRFQSHLVTAYVDENTGKLGAHCGECPVDALAG